MIKLRQFIVCLLLCTSIFIASMDDVGPLDNWTSRAAYILEQLLCAIEKRPTPIDRDQQFVELESNNCTIKLIPVQQAGNTVE